jgi:hypothetical protein
LLGAAIVLFSLGSTTRLATFADAVVLLMELILGVLVFGFAAVCGAIAKRAR